jgi:Spy/CpxP family protein refolding chaperone
MFIKTIFIISILLTCSLFATGQDESDERRGEPRRQAGARPMEAGPLLRRLGLSPDQIAAIRALHVDRRDRMQEAHEALRTAESNLDRAIYADAVNEEQVKRRLSEFKAAQANVAEMRYMNELAIRRILTPEQLVQFRQMRERFDRGPGPMPAGRRGEDGRPRGPNDVVPPLAPRSKP